MTPDFSFIPEFLRPGYLPNLTEQPEFTPRYQWIEVRQQIESLQVRWREKLEDLYNAPSRVYGPIEALEIVLGKAAEARRYVLSHIDRIEATNDMGKGEEVVTMWNIDMDSTNLQQYAFFYATDETIRAFGRTYAYHTCRPMIYGDIALGGMERFISEHQGLWYEIEEIPSPHTRVYITTDELNTWPTSKKGATTNV